MRRSAPARFRRSIEPRAAFDAQPGDADAETVSSGAFACGLPLVTLTGRLERSAAARLVDEFTLLRREPVVVVSLVDAAFVDMGVLVALLREYADRDGILVVAVPAGGDVRRALDVSGLTKVFGTTDALAEAHRLGATSLRSLSVLSRIAGAARPERSCGCAPRIPGAGAEASLRS